MEAALSAPSGDFCVALVDIDHFKAYNDTYGHPAGDELLRAAGAAWAEQLRLQDLMARFGGEEFALLLPDCDRDAGAAIAERVRSSAPAGVTASAGVACRRPGEGAASLVERADQALYAAKDGGRDRLVVAD